MYYTTSHMRQILSISLPKKEVEKIKNLAKKRGYQNFSAYISHLITVDADLITEKQILMARDEARKEYRAGKAVKVKSLADLL